MHCRCKSSSFRSSKPYVLWKVHELNENGGTFCNTYKYLQYYAVGMKLFDVQENEKSNNNNNNQILHETVHRYRIATIKIYYITFEKRTSNILSICRTNSDLRILICNCSLQFVLLLLLLVLFPLFLKIHRFNKTFLKRIMENADKKCSPIDLVDWPALLFTLIIIY